MNFSVFLHIYQPPDQKPDVLERIVNESYRPLISGWLDNPRAKVTLNINACLTEMLLKNKYTDVINGLIKLAERGQLEFTASGKYHPFLPILPVSEIFRQIKLNDETNKKIFGNSYHPLGFFPPEMGYSKKVGEITADLGFKWIILDEIAYNGKTNQVGFDKFYKLKNKQLRIFFRDRRVSNLVMSAMARSKDSLWEVMKKDEGMDKYVIMAMDGETFGHHRPGLDVSLFDMYRDSHYNFVTLSELNELKYPVEEADPVDCTWATSEKEIEEGKNFYLYYNRENKLHVLQKKLIDLAIQGVQNDSGTVRQKRFFSSQQSARDNENLIINNSALAQSSIADSEKNVYSEPVRRQMLDRALSCNHMWWSNPDAWWSIEEIETGAYNLKNVINSKAGDDLYHQILDAAFELQRSGMVKKLHAEKESFKKIPFSGRAKPGEYDALIEILKKEEKRAVEKGEYELAIRWRDSVYKLQKKLDMYDFIHIIDQMWAENRLGEYGKLADKYRASYRRLTPGQPDK